VKLTGYSTLTRRLFDWEITSQFTTNMRNIRYKKRALDRLRFIHEKQKNLAWIRSNFSGDLCFLFCSNTLVLALECRKCILRGPNFGKFPGDNTPWTLLESCTFGRVFLACEQVHLFGEFARDNLGSYHPRAGLLRSPARGMGQGKVSLHESHSILNSAPARWQVLTVKVSNI